MMMWWRSRLDLSWFLKLPTTRFDVAFFSVVVTSWDELKSSHWSLMEGFCLIWMLLLVFCIFLWWATTSFLIGATFFTWTFFGVEVQVVMLFFEGWFGEIDIGGWDELDLTKVVTFEVKVFISSSNPRPLLSPKDLPKLSSCQSFLPLLAFPWWFLEPPTTSLNFHSLWL